MATSSRNTKTATAAAAEQVTGAAEAQAAFATLPSWQRIAISFVAGCVACAAGMYVGMSITVLVTNAALALTASGFIAWIIYFVGYMLTMVGSVLAGLYVQHMVLEGGVAQAAMNKVSEAGSRMGAWFSAIKLGA